jgi:hypothetical protein
VYRRIITFRETLLKDKVYCGIVTSTNKYTTFSLFFVAMDSTNSTCYIASVVAAIVVAAWGLTDVFRGKQPNEENDVQVVSRQLRGFAVLFLLMQKYYWNQHY